LPKIKQTKVPKKSKGLGDLPKTEKEWIEYTNALHEEGLGRRRKYEHQWVVNMAYYLGLQQ